MTRRFLTFLGLPMAAQVAEQRVSPTNKGTFSGRIVEIIPPLATHDEVITRAVVLLSEESERQKSINAKVAEILANLTSIVKRSARKPANGEGTVCGVMAEPVKPRTDGTFVCSLVVHLSNGPTGNYECTLGIPVRCAHCSNAFYQDAEKTR